MIIRIKEATITLEDDLWRVKTDDGFNMRFESAKAALNWVRSRDEACAPCFTIIEWRNTYRGFEPPIWKIIE